jgi:DNA-binding response OmpR family regulator
VRTLALVVLDLVRGEVEVGGRVVRLSRGEIALLKLLADQPGRPRSAPELARALGMPPGRAGNDGVRTRVVRVRRKIEPNPAEPEILVTAPGGGYTLRDGAVVRRRREWAPAPSMSGLALTVGQQRLLEALTAARGQPIDWRGLGQALGGRGDDDDRIRVRIAVHRLRRKLASDPRLPQVRFRRGFGYTLESRAIDQRHLERDSA